ncbi:dual specificity protein kinase CLK4 isoform X4 [Scophthalmus maximus]|uniref:dual specificity protein kinase CLK4 isoform X4 n=1 Tax=Scophthalmus maximus TaxID=52904 RepID=UPI0015E07CBC|nr:dual specificity protein kinase CLK4 isoform X4 [Scophthalmus maximus]
MRNHTGMCTSWFSVGHQVLLPLHFLSLQVCSEGVKCLHSHRGGRTGRKKKKRRVCCSNKQVGVIREGAAEDITDTFLKTAERRKRKTPKCFGPSDFRNLIPRSGSFRAYLQSLEKCVPSQPSVDSTTMGIKDDDCTYRRDLLHSDVTTGSFNTSLLDDSLSLESASLDDSAVSAADDGGENSHKKQSYEVVSSLGAGAFGKVVECIDRDTDKHVAVKIVRNIECFRDVARSEIAVLEEINRLDDDNRFACVRMLDWFEHEGHICIVFELLGLSTFEFLQQNDFLPFNVEQIRHMAFQIFRAVSFLHRNKLTHTDLKPENILFVCSNCENIGEEERKLRSLDVKVVDFGTATFDHEHHESLVSTRHYRAPEVILDLGWNQLCDVWSLGCVVMEFYLGRTLFPTHDSKEHLAMMEKVLGPIPPHLLKLTKKQHYVHNECLNWDEQSSSDKYITKNCKPLKQFMQTRSDEEQQLFDLLGCMLEYDVCRRITLEEALWHPFFSSLRTQKNQHS